MLIQSTQNETVKRMRSLAAKKGRQETGLHLIEGERLVREAISSGADIAELFIEEGREVEDMAFSAPRVYTVSRRVMESMTDTGTPQWICAAVRTQDTTPPESYPQGLIVALDRVQDPGNLGTILRTADAMGAAGLLLGGGCADPFGPKVLRSTMGSVYHIPLWQGELTAELAKLREAGFSLICGHLAGTEVLPEVGDKCVLIIGNEGSGVSDEVADMCKKYRLPMYGRAESLNASVAAGILMYEIAHAMRGK
ncbi:MAG: RNA methyltransferase [Clostridia bacterium]|nr:RNA methyltransferase [Clostridia bacterium]